MSESHSVVSDSLQPHGLYSLWNSSGQNTGMGSLSLLQGIFPSQGSNPGLLHCRRILYQLSHKGSPRKLEWVVYPFSSGSSRPRNRNGFPALQADSLPTDPIDDSGPGSSVPGILQARILEWVAITFSTQSYERMNSCTKQFKRSLPYS